MLNSSEEKGRVRALRISGKSIREIAKQVRVPKSTVARWTADINLEESGLARLWDQRQLHLFGSNKPKPTKKTDAVKSSETVFFDVGSTLVSKIKLGVNEKKLFCSLLYWSHGAKNSNYLSFVESDPLGMKMFLWLLRESFVLDESKFRGLVYLNKDQSELEARKFWSDLSGVSLGQFTKTHIRQHTMGRESEWGNFRVNYYDVTLVRELRGIFKAFSIRYS